MKRVLKFYAPWCAPCKMLTKVLEDIKTEVQIENINIDENDEISKKYNIRSIPTMIMVDGDNEIKRKIGMITKTDLEAWLNG